MEERQAKKKQSHLVSYFSTPQLLMNTGTLRHHYFGNWFSFTNQWKSLSKERMQFSRSGFFSLAYMFYNHDQLMAFISTSQMSYILKIINLLQVKEFILSLQNQYVTVAMSVNHSNTKIKLTLSLLLLKLKSD